MYDKLRVEIDGGICHKMIQKIDNLLRELQDEKFIYTLQVRQKPDQTVDRLISRIKTPLVLRDKQRDSIKAIQAKGA